MTYTTTEENYIKAIYHLEHEHESVGTNLLSAAMQTKPASVTDMLKKLEAKKLLHYEKYRGFRLSDQGNKLALTIIRKHRLWEYFLVEKLGFNWDEVHVLAEQLEHVSSEDLIRRLDEFLEHPAFDPHGDPIPDVKGKFRKINQDNLLGLPLKKNLKVSAVKNQESEMLNLLTQYEIKIGTQLKILRRFAYDGSVEIRIEKNAATILSKQVAQHIYCNL
ncbi:MAG: metal-dependent transcriptional regulator [Sphingobacteriales bacterium]|nr:metal-dependent transcriptional regulator [Sphingobacteriales bacterium]